MPAPEQTTRRLPHAARATGTRSARRRHAAASATMPAKSCEQAATATATACFNVSGKCQRYGDDCQENCDTLHAGNLRKETLASARSERLLLLVDAFVERWIHVLFENGIKFLNTPCDPCSLATRLARVVVQFDNEPVVRFFDGKVIVHSLLQKLMVSNRDTRRLTANNAIEFTTMAVPRPNIAMSSSSSMTFLSHRRPTANDAANHGPHD